MLSQIIQQTGKGWFIKSLYDQAWLAAGVVQFYYRVRMESLLFKYKRRCAIKIQCAFRRWVTSMMIRWEKLKVRPTHDRKAPRKQGGK